MELLTHSDFVGCGAHSKSKLRRRQHA